MVRPRLGSLINIVGAAWPWNQQGRSLNFNFLIFASLMNRSASTFPEAQDLQPHRQLFQSSEKSVMMALTCKARRWFQFSLVCVCVCLSVCLSVCLCVCVFVCLFGPWCRSWISRHIWYYAYFVKGVEPCYNVTCRKTSFATWMPLAFGAGFSCKPPRSFQISTVYTNQHACHIVLFQVSHVPMTYTPLFNRRMYEGSLRSLEGYAYKYPHHTLATPCKARDSFRIYEVYII